MALSRRATGHGRGRTIDLRPSADRRAPLLQRVSHRLGSRSVHVVLTGISAVFALALVGVAARYFAETSWPLFRAHPGLLVAAGALSLLGYVFKAYGWRQLFAATERPQPLVLAAANGGASITALALPGRFDDVVRIAIIRRFRPCPADVRTLCLSLGMLGLIDSAALAPLAFGAAVLPGHSLGVRLGLVLLAVIGFAAAALVFALPRLARGRQLLRFRLGRWLSSRRRQRATHRSRGHSYRLPGLPARWDCSSSSVRSGSASR